MATPAAAANFFDNKKRPAGDGTAVAAPRAKKQQKQNPRESSLATLELVVPASRLGCADWLRQQEPGKVADLISLCETVSRCAAASDIREEHTRFEQRMHEEREAAEERLRRQAERCDADRRSLEEQLEIQLERHTANMSRQEAERAADLERATKALRDEISRLDHRHAEDLEQLSRIRGDCEARSEAIVADAKRERDEMRLEIKEERQKLYASLATLSGSTSRGEVGENLVDEIFAEFVQMGHLFNVSGRQVPGFADRYWELPAATPIKEENDDNEQDEPDDMALMPPQSTSTCLVEIKFNNSTHSQKDLGKFHDDVLAGVRSGRIEAAMYVSIASKIQSFRQFEIRKKHGIYVLYVSRLPTDGIDARALIRFAFQTMFQLQPLFSAGAREDDDECADAFASSIVDFLNGVAFQASSLTKGIKALQTHSDALYKEAKGLEKVQREILDSVGNLQHQFPHLLRIHPTCTSNAAPPVDLVAEAIRAIEAAIANAEASGKSFRYPKSRKDAQVFDEGLAERMSEPVLEEAVKRVKERRRRNRAN